MEIKYMIDTHISMLTFIKITEFEYDLRYQDKTKLQIETEIKIFEIFETVSESKQYTVCLAS